VNARLQSRLWFPRLHRAIPNRIDAGSREIAPSGAQHLTVTIVPDSGTGELAGLAGTMTIVIADGKHSYEFDYTLGGTR
jgi:hypothetical protein